MTAPARITQADIDRATKAAAKRVRTAEAASMTRLPHRHCPEHCETCFGPVMGRSDLELDLSHIAYWIVVKSPLWLWQFRWIERLMFGLLPWAGNIAYACHCRDKNHAARHWMQG